MPSWSNKEQHNMDSRVINSLLSLRCKFFAQVKRVLVFDVLYNRLPAAIKNPNQVSLLTRSPYPGVFVIESRSCTPFSSIRCETVVTSVVFPLKVTPLESTKCEANRVLTRVDFPRPDLPTTITLKLKPLFLSFLWICSVRVSKPT
jgi:hypothetical protein